MNNRLPSQEFSLSQKNWIDQSDNLNVPTDFANCFQLATLRMDASLCDCDAQLRRLSKMFLRADLSVIRSEVMCH
jgi:hypothetical protein